MSRPAKKMMELKGQIERITYSNDENGYTVARVKVYGRRDLVTVIGNFMSPQPGEVVRMRGEWMNHPKYGEQFRVDRYWTQTPAGVYGIKKYLGSGLVKGIGPVIAERIAKKFGDSTLNVIDEEIDRLNEVEGIGKKRIDMIRTAWAEQKEIREVMVFLQSHGVSSGYATKIFRQYGKDSIEVVQDNPYRLAMDIFGIGFITADRIAVQIGFEKNSLKRVEAGLLFVLNQLSDDGHTFYPYEPLMEKCGEMLEVDREIILQALGNSASEGRIVIEDLNTDLDSYRENNKAVFLVQFHVCERQIAYRMKRLMETPKSLRNITPEKALLWVESRLSITLAANQKEAVRSVLVNRSIQIITGGPGVGKTTIINAMLKIFLRAGARVLLAAPTGRAAKRMSEATGRESSTIHRLLEYSISQGGFKKNDEHPLTCDVIIIDEASMIDTVLMHHLLKAVPYQAILILVGDVNQLPSVGPGNVFGDIIRSGAFPVTELNEIFRQARESRIIVNSHRVNNGRMPYLNAGSDNEDFYFIEKNEPEEVLDVILRLVSERIPQRFRFDPLNEVQVLTPMRRGIVGTGNLNKMLQERLNTNTISISRGDQVFRLGDKVMQIRNNYEKDVFNGDIGRIEAVDTEEKQLTISFDNRMVTYDYPELDEIIHAYAISVHKSQGSEYPAVVIPVVTQHYVLLQRNLLYTAITRGKKLVVLVGSKKALAIAVHNQDTRKRFTRLGDRL